MTIKDKALRAAVLKALSDAVAESMKTERAGLFDALVDLHDATGAKSLDVMLPDGTKVGAISLTVSSGGPRVADRDAFMSYVSEHYPAAIYIPPTAEQVVASWQEEFFERGRVDGEIMYDPTTGEEVPGVTVDEGGKPKTFSVRFESKKLDGRSAIAQAWVSGALCEAVPDFTPPALPGDAS